MVNDISFYHFQKVLHRFALSSDSHSVMVKDFLKHANNFFYCYFTKYFLPLMIYRPLARVDLSPPTTLPSIV